MGPETAESEPAQETGVGDSVGHQDHHHDQEPSIQEPFGESICGTDVLLRHTDGDGGEDRTGPQVTPRDHRQRQDLHEQDEASRHSGSGWPPDTPASPARAPLAVKARVR